MSQLILPYVNATPGQVSLNVPSSNEWIFIEMWGGKGGHARPWKKSLSGYTSFYFKSSRSWKFDFTIAGGGAQSSLSPTGGGGFAGGPLAFSGGGATTLTISSPNVGIYPFVAVAAGGGGASANGDLGAPGGKTGGIAEGPYLTAGFSATETSNGAKAIITGLSDWLTLPPQALMGGAGWTHLINNSDPKLLLPRGGGGGAGWFSGSGGGSRIHILYDSYESQGGGGGGGGSNRLYLSNLHPSMDVHYGENRTATRGAGKRTTHPLYVAFSYASGEDGKDGCIRLRYMTPEFRIPEVQISAPSVPPPAVPTTQSSVSRITIPLGTALPLAATAATDGESHPVSWTVQGQTEPTEDFVMKNITLPTGIYDLTATANNSTGGSRTVMATATVFSISFQILSPTNPVYSFVNIPIQINGVVFTTPAVPLLTLRYKIDEEAFSPLNFDSLTGAFQLSYTPLTVRSHVILFEAQIDNAWVYTRSIDISVVDNPSASISVLNPPEFTEWIHDQPISFNAKCITQLGVDVSANIIWDDQIGVVHQSGPNFTINPQAIGFLPGQQAITLFCNDTTLNSGDQFYTVSRPFTFYTYSAHLSFVNMQTTYSVDDVTEILVDTVADSNYRSLDLGSGARGFVYLYLDDSESPFGFGGSGILPLPLLGPHSITAVLYKKDVGGDSSQSAETLIESTWQFEVSPSTKPLMTEVEASLNNALFESYTVSASSYTSKQVELSDLQEWTVNGAMIGTGQSVILNNLASGPNSVIVTITDPISGSSSLRSSLIMVNDTVDCLAGDNMVDLADGTQVKLAELQPGMQLLDYFDQPISILELRHMPSKGRHFVQIEIPDSGHSVLLTAEHPILYENLEIPAKLIVGQPQVHIYLSNSALPLYHIVTQRRTFVRVSGVYVATIGE